jgi:hypothetical protein
VEFLVLTSQILVQKDPMGPSTEMLPLPALRVGRE